MLQRKIPKFSPKRFFILTIALVLVYLVLFLRWEFSSSAKRNAERVDWHDYEFIRYEKTRVGPGEGASRYKLTDPRDIEENDVLFKDDGSFLLVSNQISLTRGIREVRHEK